MKLPCRHLFPALGLLLLPAAPSRAEVFESNGWRIEKTVQSVTPTSITYYIDVTRTGADAGLITFTDERDTAVTSEYGPAPYPAPFSGGGTANTITWTQEMPNGASTYSFLSTILKPDLPPGTRVANKASVTDASGTVSVIQTVWVGRDNDTTKASGSGHTGRDPVNTRTGEYVYDPGTDFDLGGPLPLRFTRGYASRLDDPGTDLVRSALGAGWMHNFDVQLVRQDPAAADRSFFVILEGGKVVPFTETEDGAWTLNLKEPLTPYALKSDGEDLWFCDPDRGRLCRFDDADRAGVKEIADRNGNSILIGRRADGLATNAADGLGRELRFEYNAASNLVRVTDGTREVGFGYGPNGELVAATNALGQAETYAYDPTNSFTNGNGALLAAVAFPRGNVPLVQTYDADGRVVRQADADGNEATFAYGATNNTTYGIVTDPDGSTFRHEYQNGAIYKAFDAYSNFFQYGFSGGRDALGSLRDRRNNDSRINRDYATRRVYEVQDRLYGRTQYQHLTNVQVFTNREFPERTAAFTFHDLWIVTNRNMDNTSSETFFRDGRGNVTGYVDRADQRWNIEINARGQPTAIIQPGGGTQTFTYNGDGTLASASDSDVGATTYVYDGLRRRIGAQHPDGATEGWDLDALGRVTAYTNAAGGVTRREYDANGNLTRVVDPLGYETIRQKDRMDRTTNHVDSLGPLAATTYDVMGRPVAVADPAGTNLFRYDRRGWATNAVRGARTWTQKHDKEGNVTNAISPGGATNAWAYNIIGWPSAWYDPLYGTAHFQTATWLYDYRGNLTRVKNQMNETIGHGWDKADRLVVLTNAAMMKAYFEYDADGNRTRQTDFDGHATTFGYTPMGRLAAVTNALGEATRFEYDAAGRLARTIFADGTSQETAYDGAGRPATFTDETTNAWRAVYDVRGAVVAATNPASGTTTYDYNLDGTLQTTTDSDVGPVSNRYDAARRLVETVGPDGARVQYAYDEFGALAAIVDALGRTNRFSYDADGRLVAAVDALGRTNRYFYDAAGRLTNVVDRAGGNTSYEYDLVGRLLAVTDATGVRTAFDRDANGRIVGRITPTGTWHVERNLSGAPVALQTPLGRRTAFGLDALHRVARITNALGETSTITHDSRGRVTAVTDPTGRVTQTAYDPRGLPSAVVLPDSNSVAYAWNSIGRLERLADLNGAAWNFTYTPMGRMQTITDPLFRATHYGYDARGQLASVAYPDGGTATFTRDANGSVVRVQYSGGPDLPYSRDALGRVTNAGDVALAFDAEGRVAAAEHAGTVFGATHDAAGRLATATYPAIGAGAAFTVAYQYSVGATGLGLLTNVSDSLTGTRIGFAYDADHRLRTVALPNVETITTTWDAVDRLVRLQSGEQVDLEMTYDLSGRITDVDGFAPLTASGHVAAAIASLTFDAASQISSPGYAHDARGRVTATPARTFAWDGASRLTNANDAACAYDGFNQLRTRADGAGTNRFFYHPAIAGAPLVAETDASTGDPLRYYVWTPGGRLLYMIDAVHGNAAYFYHFDPVGNVLALTDTNRAVAAAYAYDPYGRILAQTGTVTQPFTYSGAWGVRQDGDSGTLYQMRARWYDATLGRFLSPEPLWPRIGHPKSLNPYQYAGGDPIRFIDPSGREEGIGVMANSQTSARQFIDPLSVFWMSESTLAQTELERLNGEIHALANEQESVSLQAEHVGLSPDRAVMQWYNDQIADLMRRRDQLEQVARRQKRMPELAQEEPSKPGGVFLNSLSVYDTENIKWSEEVPSHSQPLDVQQQRPIDPAQDYVARGGQAPMLSDQTARYQPVAVQMPPPAAPPLESLASKPLSGYSAADIVTGLFDPIVAWDSGIRYPTPRGSPPAPPRYTIPDFTPGPKPPPPAEPLPNPGDVLDWMFSPAALRDYARQSAPPPPLAPNRFQGRRYPDLRKARNDAFSRVAARLQSGDAAGAREALDALKQADQNLTDYRNLYPFSPFIEK